ncbi:MAG: hypothetical protein V4437_00610 [Patescibacteria group bacterium]
MSLEGTMETVETSNPLSAMWDNMENWGRHLDANARPRHVYGELGWSPHYEPPVAAHAESKTKKGMGEAFMALLFAWALKRAQKKQKVQKH